jgi:hypothetical protein
VAIVIDDGDEYDVSVAGVNPGQFYEHSDHRVIVYFLFFLFFVFDHASFCGGKYK